MIKYCECCGIEIADTDIDSIQRFNAVRFCSECIEERRKFQKAEYKKRVASRRNAEKILAREEAYLKSAEEVLSIREKAKSVREQRLALTSGMSVEQRLRTELKAANRHIAELQRALYQGGADYINLHRKQIRKD